MLLSMPLQLGRGVQEPRVSRLPEGIWLPRLAHLQHRTTPFLIRRPTARDQSQALRQAKVAKAAKYAGKIAIYRLVQSSVLSRKQ
jgi:hypothetical protein